MYQNFAHPSAIAANCADIIAPPGDLPARILACLAQAPTPAASGELSAEPGAEPELESTPLNRILRLLQQRTRHDFSLYKPSSLHRRMERRMAVHEIATLMLYADFLQRNPQEIDLLFKEVLIGATSFFRDAPVWQYLADITLPVLLARRINYKR